MASTPVSSRRGPPPTHRRIDRSMMGRRRPAGAGTALVVIALLTAAAWRGEVEWRGWEGVAWVGWFHWAIPLGAVLFAGWLWRYAGAREGWLLAGGFLLICAVAYHVELRALHIIYARFPPPPGYVTGALIAAPAAFVLLPVLTWLLARRLGASLQPGAAAPALVLYLAALPLTVLVLGFVGHPGADLLHAIKTGWAIAPLVYALGWPLAR